MKFKIIRPSSLFLKVWHIIIIVIILYYLFEIGLLIGYGPAVWDDQLRLMYGTNIFFLLLLFVDLLISPLKAIFLYGHLIVNHSIIIKTYLYYDLWVDLISLISVVIPYLYGDYIFNYTKLFFVIKMNSLYKIEQLFKNQFQTNSKFYTAYSIARIIMVMIIISHFIGIYLIMKELASIQSTFQSTTPTTMAPILPICAGSTTARLIIK